MMHYMFITLLLSCVASTYLYITCIQSNLFYKQPCIKRLLLQPVTFDRVSEFLSPFMPKLHTSSLAVI